MKPVCPSCRQKGAPVGVKTILQHIRQPWLHELSSQSYYFCVQAQCDVVYFAMNVEPIHKTGLRTTIGIKEKSNETLLCYCFGVTKAEAQADSNIKEFVTRQTKAAMCACETANPSGKCCLKDFPA